jgi:cobalt-zinc-cadmium efflux system membrane fusion protein
MMRQLRTSIVALFLTAHVAACDSGRRPAAVAAAPPSSPAPRPGAEASAPPAAATSGHESEEHEALPSKIQLDPKVIKSAGIVTGKALLDVLPATVDLTGELAADPDRTARLTARVPGRILEVRAKEGGRVRAGDVVAVLDSPELAHARAALASVTARAHAARLNADRLAALETKALVSGQEVAGAAADAAALDAEVAAARQTLGAFGVDVAKIAGADAGARQAIRSPLSGFVLARDAVQGQTVEAAHVIAVIGDLDRAYFLGRLFEKDLAVVRPDARVEVRLNAYPHEIFTGTVETIGKQLDPAARTVTARIVVHNHGDLLKVGLFGSARVVTGPARGQRKRIVVPASALTRIADKDVVFVQQPDGAFEVHHVTPGSSAAGRIEVLTGLREGEDVVVDGVFTLKSAVLKRTFGEDDEGH